MQNKCTEGHQYFIQSLFSALSDGGMTAMLKKKLTVHKHDCFYERGGTGVVQPTEAGRLPTLPKAGVGTALEHWIVHIYPLWS